MGEREFMALQMRTRWLRNKISPTSRGTSLGLSSKQLCRKATQPNRLRKPPETVTAILFTDLLNVNVELPYTTIVEEFEEFLYQSELRPRV
jgi:hypothetical protein